MWCKACSTSDPTTDTVRVTFPPAATEGGAPGMADLQEEAARKRAEQEAEEARRRAEEEEARRQAAVAAAAAAAAEEEERRLRAAEEAERRRQEEEQHRQREAEEARKREEAARREEQRRQEEAARLEQERQKKQAADKQKVEEWLKKNGFTGPAQKKKSLFSSTYPLHAAVKANDAEMVSLLISQGADTQAKNSSGQTPLQLAQKSDKAGSHAIVMRALGVGVGGA